MGRDHFLVDDDTGQNTSFHDADPPLLERGATSSASARRVYWDPWGDGLGLVEVPVETRSWRSLALVNSSSAAHFR